MRRRVILIGRGTCIRFCFLSSGQYLSLTGWAVSSIQLTDAVQPLFRRGRSSLFATV